MKINTKLKNSCFLDSSLGCFLSLNDFCWNILSIKTNKENKEMELVTELKDLIRKKNKNETLDFKKIKEILGKVNEEYNKNNQEDVNEFISIFLEQLIKELIGKGDKSKKEFHLKEEDKESFNKLQTNFFEKNDSFLLDLFYGRYKLEIKCLNQHIIKSSFHVFNILTLPHKYTNNFEKLLNYFQDKKKIYEEIICPICHHNKSYYSVKTLFNLPYYLICYINEQEFDNLKYLNTYNFIKDENIDNDDIYELVGTIPYYVNSNTGHYTYNCIINHDSDIKINKNVVMVFFEKIKKSNV